MTFRLRRDKSVQEVGLRRIDAHNTSTWIVRRFSPPIAAGGKRCDYNVVPPRTISIRAGGAIFILVGLLQPIVPTVYILGTELGITGMLATSTCHQKEFTGVRAHGTLRPSSEVWMSGDAR